MICSSGTTPTVAGCDARAGGGVMRPTGDGTGGDLAHIWLFPGEEQVDERHRTWLLRPELLMLGRVSREEEKRTLDMLVSLLVE